jgi:hypothetical protein
MNSQEVILYPRDFAERKDGANDGHADEWEDSKPHKRGIRIHTPPSHGIRNCREPRQNGERKTEVARPIAEVLYAEVNTSDRDQRQCDQDGEPGEWGRG